MITKETTERNDANNWVKRKLVEDGFTIIEFEGFTVKDEKVTGFFDRRMFDNLDFDNLSDDEVFTLIEKEEVNLDEKIAFSKSMDIYYRYVFYSYNPRSIYVYRFEDGKLRFKQKYNDFCKFIEETKKIRNLTMSSPLEERGMPLIDHILRNECNYAWMGNIDGLFVSNKSNNARALVEFQTTKRVSVKLHCNNTFFAPRGKRKGDEQRWKVSDIFSQHSKLPLIIIVWSPKEVNGDIKYKIVEEIVFSDNKSGKRIGLHYSTKEVIQYEELSSRLNLLINK